MAGARSQDGAKEKEQLLTGLRKGLDGQPRVLQGSPASQPLFAGGKAGAPLAQKALDEGYVELAEPPPGPQRRRPPPRYARLTAKGRGFILEADSPKKVLEELLPVVKAMGTPQTPAEVPEAFRQEVEKAKNVCGKAVEDAHAKQQQAVTVALTKLEQAAATCRQAVEGAYAKQQEAVTAALGRLEQALTGALAASAPSPAPDARPVLVALDAALARVTAPLAGQSVAPPGVQGAPSPPLGDAILAFVDRWVKEKTVGCQFDVLWNHLKERHPALTIGEFQNALRKLHEERRIRLGGWPRMLDDIPQPNLALFISSKVMYYAQPAHSNG